MAPSLMLWAKVPWALAVPAPGASNVVKVGVPPSRVPALFVCCAGVPAARRKQRQTRPVPANVLLPERGSATRLRNAEIACFILEVPIRPLEKIVSSLSSFLVGGLH